MQFDARAASPVSQSADTQASLPRKKPLIPGVPRPPRPARTRVKPKAIPGELKDRPQWVVWRYEWDSKKGGWAKRPKQITGAPASSTGPKTWTSFDEALQSYYTDQHQQWDGVGIVATKKDSYAEDDPNARDDPFTYFDLDHCIVDGKLTEFAQKIVRRLNSYTEISPSGDGIRIIVRGRLPKGSRNRRDDLGIEVYETGRYLTITGDHLPGTPTEIADADLGWVAEEYLGYRAEAAKIDYTADQEPLSQEDLALIERAKNARNGNDFALLWGGGTWDRAHPENNTGAGQAYESQSRADLALCNLLRYWTNGDVQRMDRLFRHSGLMRAKWDESRGDTTYGAMTIARAMTGKGPKEAKMAAAPSEHAIEEANTPKVVDLTARRVAKRGPRSLTDRLLEEVLNSGEIELFTDERGIPYLRFRKGNHHEHWPLESKDGKSFLGALAWNQFGTVAKSEHLNNVLTVLRYQAQEQRRHLHNRVAWDEGAIWYDLSDETWRAVKITDRAWEIVEDPPPLFRRLKHQRPQVEPVQGGYARIIEQYLPNLEGRGKMIAAVKIGVDLIPDIPHYVGAIWGPAGNGKTTLGRLAGRIVDPSVVETLRLPDDVRDTALLLDHHYMSVLDNLTHLGESQSDVLCRAVTGEAFATRALYTDDDETIREYHRVVYLTAISQLVNRPDLLTRSLHLRVKPGLAPRPEQAFWRDFEDVLPRILGGYFDCLVYAMKVYPRMQPTVVTRMADADRWGMAMAEAMGYGAQAYMDALQDQTEDKIDFAIDESVVAQAVVGWTTKQGSSGHWQGSIADLFHVIRTQANEMDLDTSSKAFPASPPWMGRRLRELEATLVARGITIQPPTSHRVRVWQVTW